MPAPVVHNLEVVPNRPDVRRFRGPNGVLNPELPGCPPSAPQAVHRIRGVISKVRGQPGRQARKRLRRLGCSGPNIRRRCLESTVAAGRREARISTISRQDRAQLDRHRRPGARGPGTRTCLSRAQGRRRDPRSRVPRTACHRRQAPSSGGRKRPGEGGTTSVAHEDPKVIGGISPSDGLHATTPR